VADTTELRSPHYFDVPSHFRKIQSHPSIAEQSHFSFLVTFSYHFQSPFFSFSNFLLLRYYISQWVAEDTTKALVRNLASFSSLPPRSNRIVHPKKPKSHFRYPAFHTQSHRIHGQRRLQRSPLAERTRRLQLSPRYNYYQQSRHGQKKQRSSSDTTMDSLLFFLLFSSRTNTSPATSQPSSPLTASSTRSTYATFSEKSKPGHRKALFDRVTHPDSNSEPPRGRSMTRTNSSSRRRQRSSNESSGIASLDLLLLLERHG
jgi:hypothetical protein